MASVAPPEYANMFSVRARPGILETQLRIQSQFGACSAKKPR